MIGAVVGVQPFGGEGLSGTGPKAGGPLYVLRLLSQRPADVRRQGELPGPVGERNTYGERPKGTILCVARDPAERGPSMRSAKAMGNRVTDDTAAPHIVAALFAGGPEDLVPSTSAWPPATGRSCRSTSPPIPSNF